MSVFKNSKPGFEKMFRAEMKYFGEQVKKLRTEKKMSKQELAAKCNITVNRLTRTEKGICMTNDAVTTLMLSNALELPPSKLFIPRNR